ncbi:hypothetical protein E4U43_007503 [Claviceps pusilla]|uniref:Uncharacterized protein n=1 Tax=Claviceps pusilla TaxID=123648 RepID=A0A9P7SY25_9HYPO|nr:hypothetical protein E4U43_007503 [Claviceps pusilla]
MRLAAVFQDLEIGDRRSETGHAPELWGRGTSASSSTNYDGTPSPRYARGLLHARLHARSPTTTQNEDSEKCSSARQLVSSPALSASLPPNKADLLLIIQTVPGNSTEVEAGSGGWAAQAAPSAPTHLMPGR